MVPSRAQLQTAKGAQNTHCHPIIIEKRPHRSDTTTHPPEGSAESKLQIQRQETNNKMKMTFLNRPIFLK